MADTTKQVLLFTFDGIEHNVPIYLNGKESVQVRKWTDGLLSGGVAVWVQALEDMDPSAWSAAITIAMRRKGIEADYERISADIDLFSKLEVIGDPEGGDDADPPTDLSSDANLVSTSTHDGIGNRS